MPAESPNLKGPKSSKTNSTKKNMPVKIDNLMEPLALDQYADKEAKHQPEDEGMIPFGDWVKMCEGKGTEGTTKEYQELRRLQIDGTYEAFQANRDKNRYRDVLCKDNTRVVLKDNLGSDYIHANYIDGYKHSKKYICTQGPMPNTFIDFWRMIWQEQTQVIVMTTRLVERAKQKSGQYWPVSNVKNYRYGSFLVSLKHYVQEADYDLSYLLVRKRTTEEDRWVLHVLYHAWPDFKVPKSPLAFLEFQKTVHSLQRTMVATQLPKWGGHPLGPPIVIHCSAGIGRTGTFCAIDICLQRLQDTGKINVMDTVKQIRMQRVHSIQTPEQYMFIHLVLIEYAVSVALITVEKLNLSNFIQEDIRKKEAETLAKS